MTSVLSGRSSSSRFALFSCLCYVVGLPWFRCENNGKSWFHGCTPHCGRVVRGGIACMIQSHKKAWKVEKGELYHT